MPAQIVPATTAPVERPLRIAHFALGRTNPEAADGIDKTVYHLSRTQAGLGHSVRLFSVTNKPPIPIPGVQVSVYRSITPSPLLFTPRLRDLLAWRSPLNLPGALIADLFAWTPDILHLHGVHIPQNLRLARRARRDQVPYCVTVHGMLARGAESRHRWAKRVAALVQRPFLDRAAFLHALTDDEEADLRMYGTRAPIVVAPNGIDLDAAPATPWVAGETAGFEQPDSQLKFMFLGRLDPDQKGLDLLLQGFAQAELGQASLTLVGPDWRESRRNLEALADHLGVASRVRFVGAAFGPRKYDLLAHSTVFVHTSRWEGLAFSVLEAAGLGKPSLLTTAADPRGKFGPAGAAIVVSPTAGAIAEGMRKFAHMEPCEWSDMGCRARTLVETEFAWPATARVVTQAYRAYRTVQRS
jgi:glycosyltransferase involved in cell wall biosynthesis